MAQVRATSGDILSILDTDLYKLTMQCVVHAFYAHVRVSYALTNRTPHMRLNRKAFEWIQQRVEALSNIRITDDELKFLRKHCTYLDHAHYLQFLEGFRFRPSEHVKLGFTSVGQGDEGDLSVTIEGLWVDTILYEIPILALVSEAYFRFIDTDWTYEGQVEKARDKGIELLKNGCVVSEFGTRRRRDFHAQDLVMQGLHEAKTVAADQPGKLSGTSNVHFAKKYGVEPIGTVAHEWFMGLAASTDDYANATNLALQAWVDCFGIGVLSIALTDTFGTPTFLKAFSNKVPRDRMKGVDGWISMSQPRYADIFAGVRQDSGDPVAFVKLMREYYDSVGIKEEKGIVFSDSLNVQKCLEYKAVAEKAGFKPSFGIGTFFTSEASVGKLVRVALIDADDFRNSSGQKSSPLNIVIKLASANGRPAIKLSDDVGKNTGSDAVVEKVKEQLHYTNAHWEGAEESKRWND